MQKRMVLCFNINALVFSQLEQAAAKNGAQIKAVEPARFSNTVGSLLGVLPEKKSEHSTVFFEPMLIMSGFDTKAMEAFLNALNQAGVRIPYKAMVTPTNLFWQCDDLFVELAKEHEQIRRMKEKNDS